MRRLPVIALLAASAGLGLGLAGCGGDGEPDGGGAAPASTPTDATSPAPTGSAGGASTSEQGSAAATRTLRGRKGDLELSLSLPKTLTSGQPIEAVADGVIPDAAGGAVDVVLLSAGRTCSAIAPPRRFPGRRATLIDNIALLAGPVRFGSRSLAPKAGRYRLCATIDPAGRGRASRPVVLIDQVERVRPRGAAARAGEPGIENGTYVAEGQAVTGGEPDARVAFRIVADGEDQRVEAAAAAGLRWKGCRTRPAAAAIAADVNGLSRLTGGVLGVQLVWSGQLFDPDAANLYLAGDAIAGDRIVATLGAHAPGDRGCVTTLRFTATRGAPEAEATLARLQAAAAR